MSDQHLQPNALFRGSRVVHCNARVSYGHGRITDLVRPLVGKMTKAHVRFNGESADRLVWLDDLVPEPNGPAPTVRASLSVVPAVA